MDLLKAQREFREINIKEMDKKTFVLADDLANITSEY